VVEGGALEKRYTRNRIVSSNLTPTAVMYNKEMPNITTCLWFDTQAEDAADFYVKVFTEGGRKAKIGKIVRYGAAAAKVAGRPEGSVLTVEFELDGNSFLGLNGGPIFKFSQATSFIISCKTQEEIDHFWNKLSKGGKEGQCGWIDRDKFGISWQVVPSNLGELISKENAMKAMLAMKKLDIAALKKAAN
jgi:predicted 3-demethylubiquinone-9 3-methyltransferase (glyoxalase superfamily)